ncbi:MAG: serine hydrolase [Patescibacteria group bacterium]|nr:serine hydrolase [Patescibacteria group bacterium]
MFSFLVALSLYLALSPVHPALSFNDVKAPPGASLQPAPVRAVPLPTAPQKKDDTRLGVETTAPNVMVMDWDTSSALYAKNSDVPQAIASITKLMTALVVLEHEPQWESQVEMLPADQRAGDVSVLMSGEKVTVRDLFYLSLIASSNDATAALARSTGLTPEEFAAEMNRVAKEVGLKHATFVEPTGLDSRNVASASDAAVLVRRALGIPIIQSTVTNREYSFTNADGASHRVRSTDNLLDSFLNKPPYKFLGGKTGYIQEAGYCFGAAAENNDGRRVIAVVLGAADKEARFKEVKSLIYWAFDAYVWPPKKR